ncbi:MAG: translation initiation factor [Flavobacteriales bacterium]
MAKLNSLDSLKSLFKEDLEELEKERKENPEIEKPEPLDYGTKKLHIQYERKGRGGKEVCVVSGFDTDDETIKTFAKKLKQSCGLGGSVKSGEILVQGKAIDKIEAFLLKEGFKVTRNK